MILNKNEARTKLSLERFEEMLGGAEKGVDVLTSKVLNLDEPLMVPGKSALILEIE